MTGSLLAVLLLAAAPPSPSPAATGAEAAHQLLALEEARQAAIRDGDMQTLGEIYAEDFSGVTSAGALVNRDDLFAVFSRTDPRLRFEREETHVRMFGETGVVTAKLTAKDPDGAVVFAFRYLHLYARQGGRWRLVAGQSTNLPK
jgi:ketosteroid isomerase-like protein